MDREWVKAKTEEQAARRAEVYDKIKKALDEASCFTDSEVDSIMKKFKKNAKLRFWAFPWSAVKDCEDPIAVMEFEHNVWEKLADELYGLDMNYERYLDSEPVEFDGDIIITDPCYIMSDSGNNDWERCEYGENMEALGITHYMTRCTIYGDWSCSVYNSDNRRKIGDFCADAGLVSVFLLDEVLKYNPSFDYHINRKWTTTLIKNFKGTVQFVVEEEQYEFDGKQCVDFNVKVVGHGINKRSGKPMNFVGSQTGF